MASYCVVPFAWQLPATSGPIRIKVLEKCRDRFDGRNLISLQEYLTTLKKGNRELEHITIVFDKSADRHLNHLKYGYGFLSQEDLGTSVRMTFLTGCLNYFCRWLLPCGNLVTLESPPEAHVIMRGLLEELVAHHGAESVYAEAATGS